jgi:arylsulfatase A-like enzyme
MKPNASFNLKLMKLVGRHALFAAALLSGWSAWAATTSPPNLIVILTDDQGYHDVGFNGCKDIPTPNLDSIASNGVCFTSGYIASALSSPSRAGLLTGRYPQRFGYERDQEWQPNNPNAGLPLSETTLADVLGKAGYETGFIGKWHLGFNPAMNPLKRGFGEFFGFLGAGHRYEPDELVIDQTRKVKSEYDSWRLWLTRNYELVKTTNYVTDELSDEAVRFVVRHKDNPFFLLLSYNAPHDPLQAPEKYLSRFPKIQGIHRRTYAAMMSAVDDGVGAVLAELRRQGLVEQTLVVYLSASGGALDWNSSDNFPLRGAKGSPWEGGWRVPFTMQWPGHLPKGMFFDQPVLSLDIFATITALANAPVNPEVPLDGVNLVPYLTGLKTGAPHDSVYMRIAERGGYAVRSGEYKLVVPSTDKPAELYNLSRDISECNNLAAAKPEAMQELVKKYAGWRQAMTPVESSGKTSSPDGQ